MHHNSTMKVRCANPTCRNKGRRICAKCKCVAYCSKFCRKKDRKRHAEMCYTGLPDRMRSFFNRHGFCSNVSGLASEVFQLSDVRSCKRRGSNYMCASCRGPTVAGARLMVGTWPNRPFMVHCRDCSFCTSSYMPSSVCCRRLIIIVLGLKLSRDISRLLYCAINANDDCVRYHGSSPSGN